MLYSLLVIGLTGMISGTLLPGMARELKVAEYVGVFDNLVTLSSLLPPSLLVDSRLSDLPRSFVEQMAVLFNDRTIKSYIESRIDRSAMRAEGLKAMSEYSVNRGHALADYQNMLAADEWNGLMVYEVAVCAFIQQRLPKEQKEAFRKAAVTLISAQRERRDVDGGMVYWMQLIVLTSSMMAIATAAYFVLMSHQIKP